ncbi:hypothetical protein ACXPWS_07600 [Mycobacterium sp. BMJ-28]
MSAKVIRCDRCRRRCRNTAGWNVDMIAGLVVGHLCPNCQTPEEDLDAELNLITGRSDGYAVRPDPDDLTEVVLGLVNTYPTPEVMRDRACALESRRRDPDAAQMVRLMRTLADDMESGDLWEVTV